jgi:hypothetical protein
VFCFVISSFDHSSLIRHSNFEFRHSAQLVVIRISSFVIYREPMFILIAGCERYARVGDICRELLSRHWPDHPRMREVRMKEGPWLGPVVETLEEERDELFLLMLDDYAICAPVKTERIARAVEVMEADSSIGVFPLCWYPASLRASRPGLRDVVTLGGAPVLLQAAIWRREWFLELASGIDPRASASGFEAVATQITRTKRRDICAFDQPAPAWVGGPMVDGFDKRDWVIPYHNLMHRGRPALEHEAFLRTEGFAFPSMGLGDSIAKVAEASGLGAVARAMERVTGKPCGCKERRERLNEVIRY